MLISSASYPRSHVCITYHYLTLLRLTRRIVEFIFYSLWFIIEFIIVIIIIIIIIIILPSW